MYMMLRWFCLIILWNLCIAFSAQTDPSPRPIITPKNVHELAQIAQIGRGYIVDIAFAEDSNILLVASAIGIWEYDMTDLTAEPLWTDLYLPAHLFGAESYFSGDLYHNAMCSGDESILSPDGRRIASASDKYFVSGSAPYNPHGIITIWDVDSSEPIMILEGHTHSIKCFLFSPDARYIVATDVSSMIRVWDVHNGQIVAHIREHAFNHRYGLNTYIGKMAIGDSETTVHLWDMDTFASEASFRIDDRTDGYVIFNEFSPDGRYLLTFHGMEGALLAWDTQTWQQHQSYFDWRYNNMTFHPTLPIVAFRDRHFHQTIWNYETGEGQNWYIGQALSVTFFPDGQWVLYDDMPDSLNLYSHDLKAVNLLTGDIDYILHHTYPVTERELSPNGQYLATTMASENQTWLWDITTWERQHSLVGIMSGFSPDSLLVATQPNTQTINLYDVETGDLRHNITQHPNKDISYPVFSPDSSMMITITNGGVLHVYDVNTGSIIHQIEALPMIDLRQPYPRYFPTIQWASDGRLIILSNGGVIRVFGIPIQDIP